MDSSRPFAPDRPEEDLFLPASAWTLWLEQLADAARGAVVAGAATSFSVGLVIETADGANWKVTTDRGNIVVVEGEGASADLVLRTDPATAEGLASGTIDAMAALADGKVRVGGDLSLLGDHQPWVAASQEAMARQDATRLG